MTYDCFLPKQRSLKRHISDGFSEIIILYHASECFMFFPSFFKPNICMLWPAVFVSARWSEQSVYNSKMRLLNSL